jgi:hypothetical protein
VSTVQCLCRYTTASGIAAQLLGLSWSKMAFGAPASATKLIASIKARGVAPPRRSVGMPFALPATSGSGSLKPWRAAFLIGFPKGCA